MMIKPERREKRDKYLDFAEEFRSDGNEGILHFPKFQDCSLTIR